MPIESSRKIHDDLSDPLACFEMAMGVSGLVEHQRLGSAVRLVGANLDGWQLVALAARKLLLSANIRQLSAHSGHLAILAVAPEADISTQLARAMVSTP